MNFIYSLLGTFFGILLFVLILISIIIYKIKKTYSVSVWHDVKNLIKNASSIRKQEYSRIKEAMGMTSILEPKIRSDIPEFNKELLFSMVENNLTKAFDCIEKKSVDSIKKDKDFYLILHKIENEVNELKEKNNYKRYDNIIFNGHAIKDYKYSKGMATIEIISSVGYLYDTDIKGEVKYNDIMKQTRYICDFVYIYDEDKVGYKEIAFGIHCPNCGAPLKKLGTYTCEYCSMHIEPINLKAWKMASYKEKLK